MGAFLFRAEKQRGDRIEIIDYTTILLEGRLPKSVQAPTCLDELVDWVLSANVLIKDMPDVVEIKFRPVIMTESIKEEHRSRSSVNQSHVAFPEKSFDLFVLYESNIVIVAETASSSSDTEEGRQLVLSVRDFCTYYILLRRYTELMDVGSPALPSDGSDQSYCRICIGNGEDMVLLPCMHSMCKSCSDRWVTANGDCPFCRHRYSDVQRMQRDQWQLEQWSQTSLENDICNMEAKLKSFWCERGTYRAITQDEWVPLASSVSTTFVVPIDFVLLQ